MTALTTSYSRCLRAEKATTSELIPPSIHVADMLASITPFRACPLLANKANVGQQRLSQRSASSVSCSDAIYHTDRHSDWDPSKWVIWFFHTYTPFVPTVTTTPEAAILKARAHVHHHEAERLTGLVPPGARAIAEHELPVWTRAEVLKTHGTWIDDDGLSRRRVLLLVQGFVLDVGQYIDEHVRVGQARARANDDSLEAGNYF